MTQTKSQTYNCTLAQHFPLEGVIASVDISGYWNRQVTVDNGSGATLGDFKALGKF